MTDSRSKNNNSKYTIYASAACNPTPHCADWGDNGLILFGAHHSVAVLDPNFNGSAKHVGTYIGHEARVNTVHWLRVSPSEPESYFISGADDCNAYVWQFDKQCRGIRFQALKHIGPVTDITSLYLSDNKWLIATAAEQSVTLWTFNTLAVELAQTINNLNSYILGLSLFRLPKSEQLLLAFGNEKGNILIWAQNAQIEENSTDTDPFRMVHQMTGHEDWVRALDVVEDADDILMASAAQDNFIRIWRISKRTEEQTRENSVDICNIIEEDAAEIRVEEKILHLSASNWCAISLESVLYGHEGWVYGVNWHKSEKDGIRLLSVSIDKSIIIWAPSEDGIWMEKVRVGEVGGNSLGFYGGKFSRSGKSIFGHSYQGGFHIWHQSTDSEHFWTPGIIVGGHFDEVRDLAWAPSGEFLLTVSADQTTRIHAPWRRGKEEKDEDISWHELARPQVHGYDMQTVAILSRYKFASGAEEKIVRTFQASTNFIENFRRITGAQSDAEGDALLETLPKGASVPSLGLSNKAVYGSDIDPVPHEKHIKDEYPENYFVPVTLDAPPQEETLMQNTLWPEMQKLYGHGFEIYALAASPDGKVLASACRATNEEHAQIILWDTATWKQIQKLAAHKLTVTQMRFSPKGQLLLSVSRDRTWALFERDEELTTANNHPHYRLKQRSAAKMSVHNRIIWTCDWSHDSKYFATGGRDAILGVWAQANGAADEWSVNLKQTHINPITAVAFGSRTVTAGVYQLAVGFSNGDILLQQLNETNTEKNGKQLQLIDTTKLTLEKAHDSAVKRLQFQPVGNIGSSTTESFLLASCGEDHFVRLFKCPI
ncbi:probable elongator complex protein 2 [Rhagoletis pomonella]|uniref:probable elongator complex protein 2 n=1 Tax=Rhagoletis pomonella TaxID=28610 RepID=UPI00177F52CC|nr:probable elongator complex protein 2 [Rhagoletis pomonella]